jgi:precorrin-6B methylase 2
MDSNKIIVHAITVEALQDMVDYMEETPVSLTEVEVNELTDLLQDAITDVVADFINHRN